MLGKTIENLIESNKVMDLVNRETKEKIPVNIKMAPYFPIKFKGFKINDLIEILLKKDRTKSERGIFSDICCIMEEHNQLKATTSELSIILNTNKNKLISFLKYLEIHDIIRRVNGALMVNPYAAYKNALIQEGLIILYTYFEEVGYYGAYSKGSDIEIDVNDDWKARKPTEFYFVEYEPAKHIKGNNNRTGRKNGYCKESGSEKLKEIQ